MLLDYFGLWYRQLSGTGSASGTGRKRQIYVEEDGKILVFKSAHQAADWLSRQKEPNRQQNSSELRSQKVVAPKVIDTKIVEPLAQKYDLGLKFKELKANEDMEALFALAQRILSMRDEEDVEILLLAGV